MGFFVEPALNAILVFRMLRISIECGVCNVAPFAFATFGVIKVSKLNGDVEGGHLMVSSMVVWLLLC